MKIVIIVFSVIVLLGLGVVGFSVLQKQSLSLTNLPGLTTSRTVSEATAPPTHKLVGFMTGPADLLTPLGTGYIYLNKDTRGVNYSDSRQVIDLSTRLLLTGSRDRAIHVNESWVYDTVVGIESIKGGAAIVTTTRAVFIVRSPTDITQLGYDYGANPNYVSSAYDEATNALYLVTSYSPDVLKYDLSKPADAAKLVYTAKQELNRITASGGKILVYYDAVASTQPSVLAEYAKTRQVAPLLIDATNYKLTRTFSEIEPATYAAISKTGSYLAIKKKLSPTLTVFDLANNSSVTLPSFDTMGMAWSGDSLFIGRDHAVWSYDATGSNNNLVKFADSGYAITRIVLSSNTISVTTVADTSATATLPNDPAPTPTKFAPLTNTGQPYQYELFAN